VQVRESVDFKLAENYIKFSLAYIFFKNSKWRINQNVGLFDDLIKNNNNNTYNNTYNNIKIDS
jgi:hypothetical protein